MPALLFLVAAIVVVALLAAKRRGSSARPVFGASRVTPGRLAEGLLHALISDRGRLRADTRIVGWRPDEIVVERDGSCGRLVLVPVAGDDATPIGDAAARHAADPAATLVIIGGSASDALRAGSPMRALHVGEDGRVAEARARWRSGAPRLVLENALDWIASDLRDGGFAAIDFETARTLLDHAPMTHRAAAPVLRAPVTMALTVAIMLCFAGQVAISRDSLRADGAAISVAYRMGAIHHEAIAEGQWQRLIAAPFLHFGVMHVLVNTWSQWAIGASLEFVMGPWRMLALWVMSAIGASLTSFVANDSSVAAGASGAVFGLLGALTTFVFLRKDVLPQPVPASLKRGVITTLVLNAAISFLPSIDMAAHAGGFVTGAVFAFFLVKRNDRGEGMARASGGLRLAVAALVISGVGITSWIERADLTVVAPPLSSRHAVGDLVLPIPQGFEVSERRTKGTTTLHAERGLASPFVVSYKVSDRQETEDEAERLIPAQRSPPPGGRPPGDDDAHDWIGLAREGVAANRAIEVLVSAPRSCREEADRLSAEIAKLIR
jgi:membrane associated rhomboid family serine protease